MGKELLSKMNLRKRQCSACSASGKTMGAGFMFHPCETCEGIGFVYTGPVDEIDYLKEVNRGNAELIRPVGISVDSAVPKEVVFGKTIDNPVVKRRGRKPKGLVANG